MLFLLFRNNLSYCRIAGASRKLPQDWMEKKQRINNTVEETQLDKWVDGIKIPGIVDQRWVNSDHVPFTIECVGDFSWGERNTGGAQVGTGGYEKQRFTVQLSITKDGRKLPVFFIFKGAAPQKGKDGQPPPPLRANSVSRELAHCLPDKFGNHYPPADKAVLRCAPKANSNQELTKDILESVIFPHIGINDGHRAGVLLDDFKAHSANPVKELTTSKKSGSDDTPENERYNLCEVRIIPGGITMKAQPIDAFIAKVVKGYYKDSYDQYSLTAPTNPSTGHPIPPSRQLCATWVVEAFDKLPTELIKKAWQVCGYKSREEILSDNDTSLTEYSDEEAVTILAASVGGGDHGAQIAFYLNQEEIEVLVGKEGEEIDHDMDEHGTWAPPASI